jgi:DNA-binding NarL/FixJ family response regulator
MFATVLRPSAVVIFEELLPGSRVARRLVELGWNVSELKPPVDFVRECARLRPLVVVVDLRIRSQALFQDLRTLHHDPRTCHLPLLAFCPPDRSDLSAAALDAGARLVAAEGGILDQLPELVEHVLALD